MEKTLAPHSSTLDWTIPRTKEPGSLQSMGSQIHFHFSLSCIGEGNGNPLQYSCLENSRDGGAWWDAVYGVAQNRTRLKRLSSSNSRRNKGIPFVLSNQSIYRSLFIQIIGKVKNRSGLDPTEGHDAWILPSAQFRDIRLCDPINHSTPGFPVHQQLLECTQSHVH